MGKTISEKILSLHSKKDVRASEICLPEVDLIMCHDWNTVLTLQIMKQMGIKNVFDPPKVIFVIDHGVPSPNEKISSFQAEIEKFSKIQGILTYESGEGICHQLLPQKGHVLPGMLIVGSDSHTTTYGALNAFSAGAGSTDIAAALASGKFWFKVPQTIKMILKGCLPPGVYAKDLILHIIGKMTADGANYMAVEFDGEGINNLSIDDRFTIANMGIEMGAKAALFPADEKTNEWLSFTQSTSYEPIVSDRDALYYKTLEWNLDNIVPQIARPHRVDDVVPISEIGEIKVQQGIIGTCTNGRFEDFRLAAEILKGRGVCPNFRLFIVPSSRKILLEILQAGFLELFVQAGAMVLPPGCGPCHGIGAVPRDGENVISSANRNFRGRMGNNKAFIYLASPSTVAASAIEGKITDPRKYLQQGK
jgi:3-isopropylmalate/(R)-2-methylmalate dehydratase large subunit